MSLSDVLILSAVAVSGVLAVLRLRKRGGACSGDCSACGGCSDPSRKGT